ncbi:hypothetical protein [Chitinophaga sp. YIM B06452]|uniref:hypothetical protein n=1 Tax=Chitinophaga sp. YIM B06452 TaxID=3082158 RepID=UPI0031FEA7F1
MKKIMFLMAAAMITFGGITAANAQVKPVAKTEQKAEKKEHKAEKKAEHHHAKKHEAKKETPAKQ